MRGEALLKRETALFMEEVAAATGGRIARGRPDSVFGGVSIDTRTLRRGELFVAIAGPRFDGHDFLADAAARGALAVMVEKDVIVPPGLEIIRVKDTTRALADLARHLRLMSEIPLVAITGSTGKTTTKEMTATLLEAGRGPVLKTEGNLNNRYGLPLTLFRLRPEHVAAVVELGMSAAGELRALSGIAHPDVAVVTNVAPVHLEFFESLDAIARAKAEILEGLRHPGTAVLNRDDPRVRAMAEGFRGDVVWFGKDRSCDVSAENWRGTVHGMRFDLRLPGRTVDTALPLPGPHFMLDFLAAAGAAYRLGVDAETIAAAAAGIRAVRHRGELRRLGQGVTLLDDCYNSNPSALQAAVVALGLSARGRRVAFLGDMLELGPGAAALHEEAGETIAGRLDVIVAVGPLAGAFLEGARRGRAAVPALHAFPDSAAAAAEAAGLVKPGDAVLVKGSRGVRMEAIVEALVAALGTVEE
jgi:UDP-N-acetylmuramoyl-tripeptide--D-alanyl-D-alanine ligase